MTRAVEIDNVSYTYPDGTAALAGVGFALESGECVGLVGASGAGKSTLALCLVGILFPDSGAISVAGLAVTKKNQAQARQKIGITFQNPDDQLFMPTVFDDVAFGPLNQGVSEEELSARVAKAIEEHGLAGLERKFPGHLSGGQKRLAALAGVMVMEPEVLILDEPTSGLDPQARRKLIQRVDALQNTRLIASHDLEMILDLCPRVILLSRGKIIADDEAGKILGDPSLMQNHGLEIPHSLLPHRHQHRRGKSV